MANAYAGGAFDIDTDTNVAGLTALKGGAPAGTDSIFVYNGATLTVESALAILLISLGETSAGAATDGQRRGNLTVDAGVAVTFTGAADGLNSGVKSNPASAPGTALESKSNTLSILGTAASPTLFDNSVGAPNAALRYLLNMKYGLFGEMGYYTISNTYGNFSGINALLIPSSDTYTTATEHDLGSPTFVTGQIGAAHFNAIMLATDQACSLDVTVGDAVLTGGTTTTAKNLTLFYPSGGLNAYTGTFTWRSLKVTSAPAASSNVLLWILSPGNAVTRYMRSGQLSAADIRPTTTVPAGLAVANPSPTADGELVVTWTNAASYAAGDKVVVYNAADDSVLGILDATLGTGRISGLTNGTAYTVYAKATSDNYVFSDATANVGPTTCTGTDTPDGVNVAPDDTVRGVAGTIDLPAIAKVAPSDTLRGVAGTMDLPAINKVAPSDTLEGVAGTMDIPAISKVAPSDTLEGVAGTMDLPSITKVAPSDTLEGVAGTMDLPAITSVDPLDTLEGVDGTMDVPALSSVIPGDTLRGEAGTYAAPSLVPTLTVADDGDGSVTATIGNNTAQVARLYYRLNTGTSWTLHGTTLTGNGTIGDLTGLTQGAIYIFQAVPYDAASTAFGAPSLCVHVRMGTSGAVSTAEQAVYALMVANVGVSAAVGTKIYPNIAPESATRPYCVLTRIDGVQEHHARAASGCSRVRVQVDSYADTYAAAKALARLARMALDGYQSASVSDTDGGTLTNVRIRLLSDQDGFDEPIAGKGRGVHRVIQDYEVAHTDEVPVFGD